MLYPHPSITIDQEFCYVTKLSKWKFRTNHLIDKGSLFEAWSGKKKATCPRPYLSFHCVHQARILRCYHWGWPRWQECRWLAHPWPPTKSYLCWWVWIITTSRVWQLSQMRASNNNNTSSSSSSNSLMTRLNLSRNNLAQVPPQVLAGPLFQSAIVRPVNDVTSGSGVMVMDWSNWCWW